MGKLGAFPVLSKQDGRTPRTNWTILGRTYACLLWICGFCLKMLHCCYFTTPQEFIFCVRRFSFEMPFRRWVVWFKSGVQHLGFVFQNKKWLGVFKCELNCHNTLFIWFAKIFGEVTLLSLMYLFSRPFTTMSNISSRAEEVNIQNKQCIGFHFVCLPLWYPCLVGVGPLLLGGCTVKMGVHPL